MSIVLVASRNHATRKKKKKKNKKEKKTKKKEKRKKENEKENEKKKKKQKEKQKEKKKEKEKEKASYHYFCGSFAQTFSAISLNPPWPFEEASRGFLRGRFAGTLLELAGLGFNAPHWFQRGLLAI